MTEDDPAVLRAIQEAADGRDALILMGLHVVHLTFATLVAGRIRDTMQRVVPERLRGGEKVDLRGPHSGVRLELAEQRSQARLSETLECFRLTHADLEVLEAWPDTASFFYAAPFYFLDYDPAHPMETAEIVVHVHQVPGDPSRLYQSLGFSVLFGLELRMLRMPGMPEEESWFLDLCQQALAEGPDVEGREIVPEPNLPGLRCFRVEPMNRPMNDDVPVYMLMPKDLPPARRASAQDPVDPSAWRARPRWPWVALIVLVVVVLGWLTLG